MKILSWNVRGLGSPQRVRRLRHLLKTCDPHIVFFMETKLCGIQMERVDPEGTRGGLCLAWRNDVNISLKNFSKRHIDVVVHDNEREVIWRFTGFYGTPYAQDREDSWAIPKNLRNGENNPWLVCGDFNEVMYGFEKKGGLPRDERQMEIFRKTLEFFQLNDVRYLGRWLHGKEVIS
ncbi:hypothetical protein V6Z11_D04G106700 [Gossypium hirsutum]